MSRAASRFLVVAMATLLATGWLTARPLPTKAVSASIVISQVYGGGGNSGATYTNDFIELFNRGASAIDVSTWSVQYASATGTTWTMTTLSGSIAPGKHYLVQEAAGAGGTTPLPAPDATGSVAMSATAGKVALVSDQTLIGAISCPAAQDFVGYGATANCSETAPTATLSNTTAAIRAADGATDTDNNSSDFTAGAPTPRNSGVISLSINNVSHNEATGSQLYDFTVSLTSPAGPGGVTFDIATQDGTATTANNDYIAQSLTGRSIPEGSSEYLFSVIANGDTVPEADETFFVNVTNVTGAAIADGQGKGTLVNDDGNPCADPVTPIYAIQGSGLSTPIPGTVTTRGVIVGDFQGPIASGLQGFYIQDPTGDANTATSDGLFVFTGNNDNGVNVGDVVAVSGFARERFSVTTLNGSNSDTSSVTNILVCTTGNPLPAPTQVLLPFATADSPEAYEGMLVTFTQSLVIAEYFNYDQFGEIVLAKPLAGETRPFSGTAIDAPGSAANARTAANVLSRIILDDGLGAQNVPTLRHPNGAAFSLTNAFRGGDTVTDALGVLTFDFSRYRIEPTGPATYTAVNLRPSAPADTGGRLTVAAQNTLNFFITADYPTGDPLDNKCGPANNVECRGWDSDQPTEFTRQRDKLLATLSGLDADVIGLNEIENSTGVDPLGDATNGIVAGLNAIFGPGTYAAINTGTIGTDAIKVGLIYRPAAVTPIGAHKLLTTAVDSRFIDTRSRPVLAQTFEENATGERFTVAVNHLKSKGSGCADIGDPDALDGQGNCNLTRTKAAQALVDWLDSDPTGSGDPDFLIIGDLNSYAREDPITAVKAGPDDTAGTADDYTNLVNAYLGAHAYSYTFDGQAGYLDHALSTPTLTGQVSGVAEWHINSDEADVLDYDTTFKPPAQEALYEAAAYRSSDHDGVIVGLNLSGLPTTITINAGDDQGTPVTTTFPTQLDLTVTDSGGNPVAGAEVTFAGPLTGASATIVEEGAHLTDSSGNLVVTAQANTVAGAFDFVATSATGTATFHLTNQAGAPDHITINAGDEQSTVIDTDFSTLLDLSVFDANGNPVPNATVTFAGPSSGASASIGGTGPYTTDADGNLLITAHANTTAGGPYDLVATSGTATATFHLTNVVGAAAAITINAGDNQSTTVDTDFGTLLDLTVVDAGNNPVPGATVTFEGPLSGATATIVETGTYTTDSNGNLVVTAHANTTAGSYDFVATSGTASATFHLTNLLMNAQLAVGASCSTFADGTATTLAEITYGLKRGKVDGLSRDTFSYWVKVSAVSGSNTFTINESITTGNFAALFVLMSGAVYQSDCSSGARSKVTHSSTNATAGTVTVTFMAPAAGIYYINAVFGTRTVRGSAAPSPATVQYEFSTTGVADTTRELELSER
jgi:predicted extracellular nuclease